MLHFFKQVFILILEILLFVGVTGSLLSFLGQYHHIFELLSHFRVTFFVLQVIGTLGFIFFKNSYKAWKFWEKYPGMSDLLDRISFFIPVFAITGLFLCKESRKWSLVGIILALPVLISVWPYYVPISAEKPYPQSILRVLNLNVLKENHEYHRVIQLFKDEKPDIIALQEPNAEWFHALKPVLKTYPYQLEIPQENNFGIGLYSKIPLKNIQVKYFDSFHEFPAILAEAQWKGHSIF